MAITDKQQIIDVLNALTSDGELDPQELQYLTNWLIANGEMEGSPRDMMQIRRGNLEDLPNLAQGELAVTLDEEALYIGGLNGRIRFPSKKETNELEVNVKDAPFGYQSAKGDGITDDSAAIQALINYVSANGGVLSFPKGYYMVRNKLTISTPFISIKGVGERKSILTTDGVNVIMEFTGGGMVENMGFETSTSPTMVTGVNNLGSKFENCWFSTGKAGIMVQMTGAYSEFRYCGFNMGHVDAIGLVFDSVSGSTNIGHRVVKCVFSGIGMGLRALHSNLSFTRTEGILIEGCGFINNGRYNMYIQDVYYTQILGCGFDLANENSVVIEGSDHTKFTNCYFGNMNPKPNFSNVLIIPMAHNPGTGTSIEGCVMLGGDFNIYVDPRIAQFGSNGPRPRNINIINNMLSALVNCLLLDSVDGCTIKDNINDLSSNPSNGSWVTVGSNVNGGSYNFGGNRWSATSPALFHTSSKYSAEYDNNDGVSLVRSYRTPFASTGSSLVLAHGLPASPDIIELTPEGDVGSYWISDITPTTFMVNWTKPVTGAWHWTAKIKR